MKKLFSVLVFMFLLFGCSKNPVEPTITHGGGAHDIRTYKIEYRVTGDFEKCVVHYRFLNSESATENPVAPGWTKTVTRTLDYTENEYAFASVHILAGGNQVFGDDRNITAAIYVNGVLYKSDTKYGNKAVVITGGVVDIRELWRRP